MNPLLVLQARAEARAMLFRLGQIDLEQALAPLEDYALEHSLGHEIACAIIGKAFHDEYNGEDDFAKSLDEAYRVIRERMANGGPGWTPK